MSRATVQRFTVQRTIQAPVSTVFETVSDIRELSKALPHVVRVDFLSEQKTGVGAHFRETRMVEGKENTTELKVTEYVENEYVRMVAESHGTIWDSIFSVKPSGTQATILRITMDAKARTFVARITISLIKGMITKAMEKDIDLLKAYSEQTSR